MWDKNLDEGKRVQCVKIFIDDTLPLRLAKYL
jgi:hypothetical protein